MGRPAVLLYEKNASFPLKGDIVVLGRSSDCDILLSGADISRRHAMVLPNSGRYILLDYKSSNGTKLNGKYVTCAYLNDGDEIGIGDRLITFRSDEDMSSSSESSLLDQIRKGRLELLTEIDPSRLSREQRADESPHIVEALELHRLNLDLAMNPVTTPVLVCSRACETAKRLFNTRRLFVLAQEQGKDWQTLYREGWSPATAAAVSVLLADLLSRLISSGWPSMDSLGFGSVVGRKYSEQRQRLFPGFRALGLPLIWRGDIQGLFYLEAGQDAPPFTSASFSLFAEFMYTIMPHLKNALDRRNRRQGVQLS